MTMHGTSRRALGRVALCAFALAGEVVMSRAVAAQIPSPLDTAGRVIVSRNEVRVYFPPPRVIPLSSPSTPSPGGVPGTFMWIAHLDGPTTLGLSLIGNFAPEFAVSLLPIVSAGRAELCRENMWTQKCSSADVAATLENGRIVLTYRDTAEIRQSFGLHRASVQLMVLVPPEMGGAATFAAPVQYVDPPIVLDSAERVVVATERRRREAAINSYSRSIVGGSPDRRLSLAVDDSVDLWIQDSHCIVDLCGGYDYLDDQRRDWGRWSLSDSSVATLHRSSVLEEAGGFPPNDRDRARKLVARRPGRTTIRVTGVHTQADTMPSYTRLDTIVEREVIVTPRARRP